MHFPVKIPTSLQDIHYAHMNNLHVTSELCYCSRMRFGFVHEVNLEPQTIPYLIEPGMSRWVIWNWPHQGTEETTNSLDQSRQHNE